MRSTRRISTRHRRAALAAAWAVVATLAAGAARADELDELRRENERLRAEVASLRDELARRDAGAAAGGPASTGTVEEVLVPSRVSLDVRRDEASGATSIASLWYRTADTGALPRKEWFQLSARRAADGAVEGPWLAVERHGGPGTLKVDAGTLTVDGRSFACPAAGYETSRQELAVARGATFVRRERLRCSLPAESLTLAARAREVRFTAGAVDFELTDEHLAAFAALAARLAREPRSASAR
ncbi:MAG: hypothetical protein AB1689_08005 [Thermodesulfobacteriota bacterium]